jgi:P-type E1-E2 ATPase
MECHTVSINEELGQIEYILTNKTGTLTCNKMVFKNIVIGNNVYGDDIKLHEIEKGFDYKRLTQRYSKLAIRKQPTQRN